MSSLLSRAAHAVQNAARFSVDVLDKAKDSIPGVALARNGAHSSGRIEALLDSRFDVEKLEGLRTVLLLMNQGTDVSAHFTSVVKNAVNSNIDIRRHVYSYVAQYAASNPELALLCVNALQKDLTDPMFATRSLALRTLAAIRISSVIPIVSTALHVASKDISPLVRRTAVLCLAQVAPMMDADHVDELMDHFLDDRDPVVVGGAVQSLRVMDATVNGLAKLHHHYRRLCDIVPRMDETGQAATLAALREYVKAFIEPPADHVFSSPTDTLALPSPTSPSAANAKSKSKAKSSAHDPDLVRLWSAATAVANDPVTTAASLFHAVTILLETSPRPHWPNEILPALLLLIHRPSMDPATLPLVLAVAHHFPADLAPYIQTLLPNSTDSESTRALKLQIAVALMTKSNAPLVLDELRFAVYARDSVAAARQLAALARVPQWRSKVLPWVLELLAHSNAGVVAEAIRAVQVMFSEGMPRGGGGNDDSEQEGLAARVLAEVVRMVPACQHPLAQAALISLVGMHVDHAVVTPLVPDVLRLVAYRFAKVGVEVKVAAVGLAGKAKMVSTARAEGNADAPLVAKLADHIIALGRADPSVDVREKARFVEALGLVDRGVLREPAKYLFAQRKVAGVTNKFGVQRQTPLASWAIPEPLGPWTVQVKVDSSVREPRAKPQAPTPPSIPTPKRNGSPSRIAPGMLAAATTPAPFVATPPSAPSTPSSASFAVAPLASRYVDRERERDRARAAEQQKALEAFLESDDDEDGNVPSAASGFHPPPSAHDAWAGAAGDDGLAANGFVDADDTEAEIRKQMELLALEGEGFPEEDHGQGSVSPAVAARAQSRPPSPTRSPSPKQGQPKQQLAGFGVFKDLEPGENVWGE